MQSSLFPFEVANFWVDIRIFIMLLKIPSKAADSFCSLKKRHAFSPVHTAGGLRQNTN